MKRRDVFLYAGPLVVLILALLLSGLALAGVFGASSGVVLGATLVVLSTLMVLLLVAQSLRHARQIELLRNSLARIADAESRHDFHRKTQLEQLQQMTARVRALAEGIHGRLSPVAHLPELRFDHKSDLPRVVFVTSNGAGMGHLTRCLAVARSGRNLFQSQFVSLSSSADVVRRFGYDIIHYPSHGQSGGMSQSEWNNRFAEFFDAVCYVNKPTAVVFDGTWIYRGIHEATQRHGVGLVWLRRGLWLDSASTVQVQDRASLVDHLLVPRDIAEAADQGPVAQAEGTVVPAVTLTTPAEHLTREDALKALSLDPARTYALIQLGAGAINDIEGLREDLIAQILNSAQDIDIVIGMSPLSLPFEDPRDRVHIVREYPLAPLISAFEFMVIAGGYNSVHESVKFGVPALVVPNLATSTDNQELRAAEYERLGFGLKATSEADIHSALDRMLSHRERASFRRQILASQTSIDSGEGAAAALGDWLRQRA